jgi:hypothetical protein
MAVSIYALTTLANLKAYLSITVSTYDTILEQSIDRATAQIETYLGRKIVSRSYTEWNDSFGGRSVPLKNYPITNVIYIGMGEQPAFQLSSSVSTDIAVTASVTPVSTVVYRMVAAGTETTTTTTFAAYPSVSALVAKMASITGITCTLYTDGPSRWLHQIQGKNLLESIGHFTSPRLTVHDYVIQSEAGIIHSKYGKWLPSTGRLPDGRQSLLVEYVGGFTTVPDDLVQACLVVASRLFRNRSKDSSISTESLGDYSYSFRNKAEEEAEIRMLLEGYRKII